MFGAPFALLLWEPIRIYFLLESFEESPATGAVNSLEPYLEWRVWAAMRLRAERSSGVNLDAPVLALRASSAYHSFSVVRSNAAPCSV